MYLSGLTSHAVSLKQARFKPWQKLANSQQRPTKNACIFQERHLVCINCDENPICTYSVSLSGSLTSVWVKGRKSNTPQIGMIPANDTNIHTVNFTLAVCDWFYFQYQQPVRWLSIKAEHSLPSCDTITWQCNARPVGGDQPRGGSAKRRGQPRGRSACGRVGGGGSCTTTMTMQTELQKAIIPTSSHSA